MGEPSQADRSLFREWIHWIMGSLVVWGLLLGLGAYLYVGDGQSLSGRQGKEETEAILRGIIIATCVVGFVTFWWVMLALRDGKSAHAKR